MRRNTIVSVAPVTHSIDVTDWDATIHTLQHNSVSALVAKTPSFAQHTQALDKATSLWITRLPIVLLEADASTFSSLTVAALAATVQHIDELREAVMELGRDDTDDLGIAVMVTNSCTFAKKRFQSNAQYT